MKKTYHFYSVDGFINIAYFIFIFKTEQLNDLKQLDSKVKLTDNATNGGGGISSSTSNNNLNNDSTANSASVTRASNENLFDEYRRRLELIKKTKPIK